MTPTEAMLPKEDPRMVAWAAYTNTPEYANTRKWALHDEHVDGSLWAAFLAGYAASAAPAAPERCEDDKAAPEGEG